VDCRTSRRRWSRQNSCSMAPCHCQQFWTACQRFTGANEAHCMSWNVCALATRWLAPISAGSELRSRAWSDKH
jgi:hypothetical protein